MSNWAFDPPNAPSPAEVRGKLLKKFRESVVDRAFQRLARSRPVQIEDSVWLIEGRADLGDTCPQYKIVLRDRRYECSCYSTEWGERRRREICSHVLTLIAARRLKAIGSTSASPGSLRLPSEGVLGNALGGATGRKPSRSFPSPEELGLPGKFRSFRDTQVMALEKILASDKRWILLQAPTGTGKTLVAAAIQKLLEVNMIYAPHTKDLQAQFIRDFPYAVELKGRENYPTANYPNQFPRIHCGICQKSSRDPRCRWCCPLQCLRESPCLADGHCKGRKPCPYEIQKQLALTADVAVLNTAYFLAEANYVGTFGAAKREGEYIPRFNLLCLDEGDLTEEALMRFVEMSVTSRQIDKLGLEPPRLKTKEEAWLEWVEEEAIPKVSRRMKDLERKTDDSKSGSWATIPVEELRELQELKRIYSKLKFFASEMNIAPWINCTEDHENGPWVFKPVFVSRYAGRNLWCHAKRFLVMSATIISKEQFCANIGIPVEQAEFIDLPSTFPKMNRPVVYIPAANMTHKTCSEEWPKALEALDKVLDLHPKDKVLVHTVSYRLAVYLAGNSRHEARMVLYDNTKQRSKALELFRSDLRPLVLVAPSMERGVDLPDDLCRVVVIAKTPYRSLGDKQVKRRIYGAKDGQAWYSVDTVRTIVQMSGRGVRHQDDYCATYILDAQFGRLYKAWKHVFPKWWRQALSVRTLDTLQQQQ